jgi:hypothetical protein
VLIQNRTILNWDHRILRVSLVRNKNKKDFFACAVEEVHIHVRKYNKSQISQDPKNFCLELFEEKEELLKYFDENNEFEGEKYEVEPNEPYYWFRFFVFLLFLFVFEFITLRYLPWLNLIFIFFTSFLYYFEQKQNKGK